MSFPILIRLFFSILIWLRPLIVSIKVYKEIASHNIKLYKTRISSDNYYYKQKKVLTQASYLNHRIKRVVFAALLPASRVAHFVNNLTDSLHKKILNHNLITHTVLHSVAQKFSLQVYTTIPNY
ncbi:hypothetical protein U3516DRAFT_784526 [Neocallimastix sp. 'constans']